MFVASKYFKNVFSTTVFSTSLTANLFVTNLISYAGWVTKAWRSEPVSRRDRPAKAPLTRRAIVETAVRLIDEPGAGRLTMRRVASELDTGPASLYVYFRNAEELYAAVLEYYLGALDLPARGPDGTPEHSWHSLLVGLLTQYTEVLFAHPAVARMAAFTRPDGPNYLRLLEALLDLLIVGGVPPRDAAWGIDVLLLHATTNAVEQSIRQAQDRSEEEDAALIHAIGELARQAPAEHHHLVALGEDIVSGPGQQRLTWGFEVLINGLLATPRPTPQ
jgi:AcrR family transcriptional regulator